MSHHLVSGWCHLLFDGSDYLLNGAECFGVVAKGSDCRLWQFNGHIFGERVALAASIMVNGYFLHNSNSLLVYLLTGMGQGQKEVHKRCHAYD